MMAEEVHYCQENLPSEAIYELLIKNVSRDVKLDREEIEVYQCIAMFDEDSLFNISIRP